MKIILNYFEQFIARHFCKVDMQIFLPIFLSLFLILSHMTILVIISDNLMKEILFKPDTGRNKIQPPVLCRPST